MIIPDQDMNKISENNDSELMSLIENKKFPAKNDEKNELSILALFKNATEKKTKEDEAPK